jgi:outer membrane lipoprotein-sorting protein
MNRAIGRFWDGSSRTRGAICAPVVEERPLTLSLSPARGEGKLYQSGIQPIPKRGYAAALFGAFVVCLMIFVSNANAADKEQIISGWLQIQTNVQTWTADFTQIRNLKALAQPLVSTGRVWFAAPQNFCWELGHNQTIAIRSNDTMMVIYPRLKRAEKYDFQNSGPNEWKDALGLLQSGFPRSRAEIDQQFNILSLAPIEKLYELELQPKSLGARKMMPQINILIQTNLTLAGTELVFADGSRMRNEFRNVRTNIPVSGKFDLAVPADFKLVEPLHGNRK